MLRSLFAVVLVSALSALSALSASVPAAGDAETPLIGVTGFVRHGASVLSGDDTGGCLQPSFLLESGGLTLPLHEGDVDLLPYVDRLVKLTVTQELGACPFVPTLFYRVHEVEDPAPATLAICGTGGHGCPIRLRSGPGGALVGHMLFVSLTPDFLPLPPLRGSFLLGSPFFSFGPAFSLPFSEGLAFDFQVPLDTALQGHTLYFQAARKEIGLTTGFSGTNPPLQFGNSVSLEIVGHVFVCHEPDC